jgi:hypothetical protein
MNELVIKLGGIYSIGLIMFHVLFWRLFKWPESLASLNRVNRATMQVLNISITLIFCIVAYVSFAHTAELLHTPLGNTLLVLISWLWLIRAVLQVVFYKLEHKASVGLTLYFLLGACLYGLPVVL